MQLGDLATWASAAATFLAVVAALWLARRDDRRRHGEDRRRQAEAISGWIASLQMVSADGTQRLLPIEIQNASDRLAYRVVVSLVRDPRSLKGEKPRDDDLPRRPQSDDVGEAYRFRAFVGELPPGRTSVTIEYPGGGMHIRWALELCFRDSAGRSWLRTSAGSVIEIKEDPLAHYKLWEPAEWQYPSQLNL
jgi:hypothetical protein